MVTLTCAPCAACGGTLAEELDLQVREALRVFCVNCGRDEWIAAPAAPREALPYGLRVCLDCGTGIDDRSNNSFRCRGCQREAALRQRWVAV